MRRVGFGVDLLASRGDVTIIPGIQKFVVNCNWKFAVDNLFDWYHPQITHASGFLPGVMGRSRPAPDQVDEIDMSEIRMESGDKLAVPIDGITGTKFDQAVVIGEYGHTIGGPTATSTGNSDSGAWRKKPKAQEWLGPVGLQIAGHPNLFPNTWVTTTMQVSVRIPRTPTTTEIWWFSFLDASQPEEVQRITTQRAIRVFGPSGILEQDDGENWAQATMQSSGVAIRRVPHALKMGLGRGQVIHEGGFARLEGLTSEYGQLWTYHSWAQWMKGLSWADLESGNDAGGQAVNEARVADMMRQFEVEQFYYREASLLDGHQYEAWLDLFTDDTHYFMPIRRTRTAREQDMEFTKPGEMAFFDDTKALLAGRVTKLLSGRAWAEDPPSRTRHMVTNVQVLSDDGTELDVASNFQLYRTRLKSEEDSWIGSRRDVLRRVGESGQAFQIARRFIYLEQTVVLSRNMSNFF